MLDKTTKNKIFKVAILGVGGRGGDAYGHILNAQKDKFDIVALCDKRQQRLDRFSQLFGVQKNMCFTPHGCGGGGVLF